jgi:flavin-dependent dehydrogenase
LKYDVIIVGAGPAGLTAGIVAARNGHNTIILERGSTAGPKPRGEGMAHMPIVDEILGNNFLPSIGLKSSGGRVWHSPNDLQRTTTFRDYDHYFFEWRPFMDRFMEVYKRLNGKLLLNCEVIEPIDQDDKCCGVSYREGDASLTEIYGNTILDCSGFEGVIGKHYGVPYKEMNCPIVKCLISNANYSLSETQDLQFYFIGNGDLDYSPNFPPSVAYFFPLKNNKAEVGLMLRMGQAYKMNTVKIPDEREIMKVWEGIKAAYPGYSDYFIEAEIDYEELTMLPNARLLENYIPHPGVILIGDSAGFVNPFGSSGLYYAMEMAKFWVNALKKNFIWTSQSIEKLERSFKEFEVYKNVKQMYDLIGAFEYKIFNRFRTSGKVNKKWDYIASLLKQA